MNRTTPQERKEFLRTLEPLAQEICPRYGVSPRKCILDAADATEWGKFVIDHNYWELKGSGDKGWYRLMLAEPTGKTQGGGWELKERTLARFSSPAAAVTAYCLAQ